VQCRPPMRPAAGAPTVHAPSGQPTRPPAAFSRHVTMHQRPNGLHADSVTDDDDDDVRQPAKTILAH